MTRKLLRLAVALVVLSALASATDAFAGHRGVRGVFGGVRASRHVTKDVHVEKVRGDARLFGIVVKPVKAVVLVATAPVKTFRAGAGCYGMTQAGGCIGTVSAAPRVVSGGCSGYGGPAMAAPAVVPVPVPMPPKK